MEGDNGPSAISNKPTVTKGTILHHVLGLDVDPPISQDIPFATRLREMIAVSYCFSLLHMLTMFFYFFVCTINSARGDGTTGRVSMRTVSFGVSLYRGISGAPYEGRGLL